MPSSYALGTYFEDFMTQLIADGRYNSKSEIIRDGLRALENREEERAIKLQALRSDIQTGVQSGESTALSDVRRHMKARYDAKT